MAVKKEAPAKRLATCPHCNEEASVIDFGHERWYPFSVNGSHAMRCIACHKRWEMDQDSFIAWRESRGERITQDLDAEETADLIESIKERVHGQKGSRPQLLRSANKNSSSKRT